MFMEYLSYTIGSQYFSWVKMYVKFIAVQSRRKREIEQAIRCLVPEILACGYSRDEIYYCSKKILSDSTDPANALDLFLTRFDNNKRKYTVYCAISNKLMDFQEVLEQRIGISYNDDGHFSEYENWDKYTTVVVNDIDALDAYSAADQAYKCIELYTSFFQFFCDIGSRIIQNKVLVKSSVEEDRRLSVDRGRFSVSDSDAEFPTVGQLTELSITSITKYARCSLPVLQKIVKLHNKAISNNGLENGYLNLWSILEVICVSNPDASKIEQVKHVAIPILKRYYLAGIFHDLLRNLRSIMGKQQLSEFLIQIQEGDDEDQKVASLILLPQYNSLLDGFVDSLPAYPVIRSRMLNLNTDIRKRDDLGNLCDRFAQRVAWHLYRIYRARNTIVHTGKRPFDLYDLCGHLHSYVDCVSTEVIYKLCLGSLCHLSNVIVDSELMQKSLNTLFSSSEPIDIDCIKFLFSVNYNPWYKQEIPLINS